MEGVTRGRFGGDLGEQHVERLCQQSHAGTTGLAALALRDCTLLERGSSLAAEVGAFYIGQAEFAKSSQCLPARLSKKSPRSLEGGLRGWCFGFGRIVGFSFSRTVASHA